MCNRDSLQPTQAKEDILTNNIQTCKISYICSHVSIGNTDTTHVVMLCVCVASGNVVTGVREHFMMLIWI